MSADLDLARAHAESDRTWEASILPSIAEYIRIPNKSPAYDAQWVAHGFMEKAVAHVPDSCRRQELPGLTLEVVRLNDEQGRPRTPVIVMEIPGELDDTVLLYGHLDKQPEFSGWSEGLSPWTPVRRAHPEYGDVLYGRGGADDGYAAYASLSAIRLLRAQGLKHARCVVLIEACEESGSYDLPAYIEHLAPRIGTPSLVVCLDSGCANYDQLWSTTSLRGLVAGTLRVDVLTQGQHSGDASGIVASSFRVLRALLSRLEDERTGEILLDDLHIDIPRGRVEQARAAATTLGPEVFSKFPWVPGMRPMHDDLTELVLNRTWRPTLSVIGVDGIPALADAGNVLRPQTSLKLSIRVPAGVDAVAATKALEKLLTTDVPYGAKVTFEGEKAAAGWDAPALAPWLGDALDSASRGLFGKPSMFMGEGGTIPFMHMLGSKFPAAQFFITGLLGPQSNAHGPNEFLHVATGKKLTAAVAHVLARHARR